MIDVIRDRAKIILIVVAAVVVLFAMKAMVGGQHSDPTGQTKVVAARHDGEDAAAKTLLQSASLAMESVFAQNGSFAGGADAAALVEPNVRWVPGTTAASASNQVGVVADASSYSISTTSASGVTFTYARDTIGHVTKTCGPGCTW